MPRIAATHAFGKPSGSLQTGHINGWKSDKDRPTPESIPEPWLVSFGAVENAFPDRFKKFEKVDSDYLSRQLFETDKAVVRDQVVKAFGKPSWVRLAGTQSS